MKKQNKNVYSVFAVAKGNPSVDFDYPEELQEIKPQIACYQQSNVLNHYRWFIDRLIEDEYHYRDLVQCLISASENDVIELVVASGGGNLSTTIHIINAIRSSAAYVRAIIGSQAHSAASIISLACDEVYALPHSAMLIHQPRGGVIGRASENALQSRFQEQHFMELFNDLYEDFLSKDEIEAVLQGKDMWLTAEEINLRAEYRDEARKERADFEAYQKEAEEDCNANCSVCCYDDSDDKEEVQILQTSPETTPVTSPVKTSSRKKKEQKE